MSVNLEKIVAELEKRGATSSQIELTRISRLSTRFGENHITQNQWQRETQLSIVAEINKKVGSISGDSQLLKRTPEDIAEHVIKVARISTPDDDFPGYAPPTKYPPIDRVKEKIDPEKVSEEIGKAIERALDYHAKVKKVAGNVFATETSYRLVNSLGLDAERSSVMFSSTINVAAFDGDNESRSTDRTASVRLIDLDLPMMSEEVAKIAVAGLNQQEIEPGTYQALLEPLATQEILGFFAQGASARTVQDHQSFLKDRIGEQVVSENLTLTHVPRDAENVLKREFDIEGTPTQNITFLENGVLKSYAYDRRTAKKDGTESNGTAWRLFGGLMPMFIGNKLQPGQKTREDLIHEIDQGVLITNLFYNNFVNPPLGTATGLTRDGLFLIEKGEIIASLKNMRWTDSILEILKNVEVANNLSQKARFFFGADRTCSILTDRFTFSSKTGH